jgi:LysW-gamma-L-lysine carboxypeptidase
LTTYLERKRLQEYAVNLLKEMVEIYSPTGKEQEIASFLVNEMEKLGFSVRQDRAGNVIGEHPGTHPKILLCGHMDTVTGLIPPRIDGGTLYGRGSVDAKGPLATFIVAASQLIKEGYPSGITLIGVVDEEGEGKGVKQILEDGVDVDYAVFGEPTNADTITVAYRGSILLNLRFETKTGHSSAPWLFENSIEKAIEFWEKFGSHKIIHGEADSHFNNISYCLERISGGVSGSVVPPHCEIEVGVRIPPQVKIKEFMDKVEFLIKSFNAENPEVSTQLIVKDATEAYTADTRSLLVRALSRSIWKVCKKRATLVRKTGTGDMNIFGNHIKIPVVTYGPGDPHLDHTPNEHILMDEYMTGINVLKETLKEIIKMEKKKGKNRTG